MRRCRSCGEDITSTPRTHFLCRPCFADAARRLKTAPEGKAESALTLDRLNQLIKLTHPDRHGNSPDANEATAWLLDLRQRVRAHQEGEADVQAGE